MTLTITIKDKRIIIKNRKLRQTKFTTRGTWINPETDIEYSV